MDRKILSILVLNSVLATALFTINWLYLKGLPSVFSSINVLSCFILLFPIILIQYNKYKKKKELEETFPVFLRDFVESVRGGMTVPQAFHSVSKNDYKTLSPYVEKIAAQLEWGIPADKVLLNFSKSVKSKIIGRVISSVIESHRYGGNLADTFEALSNTAIEVDRLREERKLYLQSQMITGYIIFFVFLAVILGLERFLVPSLTQTQPMGISGVQTPQQNLAEEYRAIFRNLILMQGLFAGLSVGKMAEGAIIAGIKHSLFMMFVGGVVFLVFG